jgi:signal transduction histidine kinase
MFDSMEQDLAELVRTEEGRAVDEYNVWYVPGGQSEKRLSPISGPPDPPFILGYLQNNPDGSFQTPLADADGRSAILAQLASVNEIFNRKRFSEPPDYTARRSVEVRKEPAPGFVDRFLAKPQEPKSYLGRTEKRVEEITASQALNIAQSPVVKGDSNMELKTGRAESEAAASRNEGEQLLERQKAKQDISGMPADAGMKTYQVEMAPMQSVFIDAERLFVFRRIVVNGRIYRQGAVIKVRNFLDYLVDRNFASQPMSGFANIRLSATDNKESVASAQGGAASKEPRFELTRTFPRPFSFLSAVLSCDRIPAAEGRKTLNLIVAVLSAVTAVGFATIYQSVRAVVSLSERRSRFVSSVTHELKTPLTNIRMYIEMLAQGMAPTVEREQEYFRIVESESARLARLIGNVLDLAKLEKKQRIFAWTTGDFSEVVADLSVLMAETLRQDGFEFETVQTGERRFAYDREVMIQVLINLIENSVKFGRQAAVRRITLKVDRSSDPVQISVSDTGPGIARKALKKVFEDFYRGDDAAVRNTGGTGIGLALVSKFVLAMGGRVRAENNAGSGCTIIISLPAA